MSLFSKMTYFCNACGCKVTCPVSKVTGREWKTCSIDCHREMEHRQACSTLGKDYVPRPTENT